MFQPNQELAEKDILQQAIQDRDDCLSHFESLHQLALKRSAIAICQLATMEFTRLERQWRRDSSHFRDFFAANHLGAAHLANRWSTLAESLDEEGRISSLDLILECVRAESSPIQIQNINDDGLFLMFRFLMMQESPERAINAWLKLSKCVDPEHFRERIELFMASGYDARTCRRELLDLARQRSAEWQESARLAQLRFDEYSKTLQLSPVPACQADRTLGAAFRDARTRLNHAEKHCQKLLKSFKQKDLEANQNKPDEEPKSEPLPEPEPQHQPQSNAAQIRRPLCNGYPHRVQPLQTGQIVREEFRLMAREFLKAIRNNQLSKLLNDDDLDDDDLDDLDDDDLDDDDDDDLDDDDDDDDLDDDDI